MDSLPVIYHATIGGRWFSVEADTEEEARIRATVTAGYHGLHIQEDSWTISTTPPAGGTP